MPLATKSSLLSKILPDRLLYLNPRMLSSSHNRAYQDFSVLLTKFGSFLNVENETISSEEVKREWSQLRLYFEQQIEGIDVGEIPEAIASRWQSVQTEIKREFKLLSTDVLFLSSARQTTTQNKRAKSIGDRLTKLIGYCKIMTEVPDKEL